MRIPVELGAQSYYIIIENGALDNIGDLLDLNRKVLVVTDSGVPETYAEKVAARCGDPTVVTVPQGEKSKSPEVATVKKICDGLDITLGEFFSTPEFDRLEQEIQ